MQKQLSTLKIIHAAITFAPLLFVLVPYLEGRVPTESPIILQSLLLSAFLVPVSSFLRRFLSSKGKVGEPEAKFLKYQSMKIVTWGVIEGAALLNAVAYFLFGSHLSLGAVIAFSLLNLIRFPNLREYEELFDAPSERIRRNPANE